MTEEQLKKLHTAMCNDNEHQCNRLNNYIHTDEYLTAEVVKVVEEIITDATKELQEENERLARHILLRKAEATKELQEDLEHKKIAIQNRKARIKDLEKQIEKMKKVLELAYKSLCRYETNRNGIGITITAESEKVLFFNWLKEVEHLIGKE